MAYMESAFTYNPGLTFYFGGYISLQTFILVLSSLCITYSNRINIRFEFICTINCVWKLYAIIRFFHSINFSYKSSNSFQLNKCKIQLLHFFKWADPASFLFIYVLFCYNFNTNWKKHRCCALDSNPGPQDGRRIWNHGAMAATMAVTPFLSPPSSTASTWFHLLTN